MASLRHHGRATIHAIRKQGSCWLTEEGRRLVDGAGGPLLQSLVHLETPPASCFANVGPPGGIETPVRAQCEETVLGLAGPNCGGILWAASGSDAIESALWAVHRTISPGPALQIARCAVRTGSYHGNTFLTHWLSTREEVVPLDENGFWQRAVLTESAALDTGRSILEQLDRLDSKIPTVLLLETVPTTGPRFWPGEEAYRRILAGCAARGIPVVLDEIAAGAYRHGWFSAFEWLRDSPPAAVVLAKGLTAGAYPLSCVLLRGDLTEQLLDFKGKLPAFTYGLNDPAAWLTLECLRRYRLLAEDGTLGRRRESIARCAEALAGDHPDLGIEATPTSLRFRTAEPAVARRIQEGLAAQDLMIYQTSGNLEGARTYFFIVCPPLDLGSDLLAEILGRLPASLASA